MKKDRFMIKDNRGASLIAVLVTLAVVSILGVIISNLTVTNIQMKEAERQSKTIFYSAEAVMDDLTAGLNQYASDAMQEAYSDMLSNFRDLTSGGALLKDVFAKIYLEKLVAKFDTPDGTSGTAVERRKSTVTEDGVTKVIYEAGYYSVDAIRNALVAYEDFKDPETDASLRKKNIYIGKEETFLPDSYYYLDKAAYEHTARYLFHADYVNKLFTLEKVAVTCTDEAGNLTTIQTDIVFHVPDVNFNGSNVVKDFMRYSLIADKKIHVNSTNLNVDGNVYAGSKGIDVDPNCGGRFIGNKIVTRGDIVATSNSTLSVGEVGKSQVWCENLITTKTATGSTGPTNSATLIAGGNIFVSDDLEMNGAYDKVTLSGAYYGYNYQENYGSFQGNGMDPKTNDNYSSAIVINGKHSNLNIENVNRLMVAGRTFIDRETGKNSTNVRDIPLADAVGIKPNQMAYYVPVAYVDTETMMIKDAKKTDLNVYCGFEVFKADGSSDYLGNPNVLPFTYLYKTGGGDDHDTVYYLNFSTELAINKFFAEYYKAHRSFVNLNASNYLEAGSIKLKEGVIMDLRGNILCTDRSGNFNEMLTTYVDANWQVGGDQYRFAMSHAVQYHSLQMYLEDHHEGIDPTDVRVKKGKNRMVGVDLDAEVASTTLFHNLIDYTGDDDNPGSLDEFFTRVGTKQYEKVYSTSVAPAEPGEGEAEEPGEGGAAADKKLLAIIDNDGTSDSAYQVDATVYSGGLIIATGDVKIKATSGKPFSGLVISGGEISFTESSDGAKIFADEVLISQMISKDIMLREPVFATIFQAYKNTSGSSVKSERVNDYLTFENWTKTFE